MGAPTGKPDGSPSSPTSVNFGAATVSGVEAEDGSRTQGRKASPSRSLVLQSTSFYKSAPASQYNSYLDSFMDGDAGEVKESLRDLAVSIAKLDDEGTPRWATAQGRKVGQKVLAKSGFLDKLVGTLPSLRGQPLADAIMLLTWLGSCHRQVIISIARNEVLGDVTKALAMIDKADPNPSLPPATLSGLLLLQHVVGNPSCLDDLKVDLDTREELMLQLLELGTFKKVVQLHRDGYNRLKNEAERTIPLKVLTQLAANFDLAAALHGMTFVIQLLNRLSTSLDDEYAVEFLWSVSRHELVHREMRTADLLATVRKIMGASKISEHSKIRVTQLVAVVYGRRSEAQTFLQTHAMPPDLANVLWISLAGAEGNLSLSLKMLNELLLGRSGYTTTTTARAAAQLLHGQLQMLELSGLYEGDDCSEGVDKFTEWLLNSLVEAAGLVEMDRDFSKAVVVLYIIQHAAIMNPTVRRRMVDNKVAIQQLIACIPPTIDAVKAKEAGACSGVAVFLLALLVETAPGEIRRQALQTLAVVPTMVRRLVTHLEAPGQQYSAMPPALYLLSALVHRLGSNRGTVAAFPHLRPLFHEALAKLLAATIGTKDTALAEQALALMDKLLEHAHQAISEYPDSLACKKLRQWSDLLFEMQAVPKVVLVLGMSPTSKVLESGTNVISRLIELGYAERVSSALPVIIARCTRAPGDHQYSMPILKMAFRREMRGPLRGAGMLNLSREWLATRTEDKQLDLLMTLAFLYSGEEDVHGIGDLLIEHRVTEMVLSVLHSACMSYDGHATIVGVKWTAVDALLLLQRLASYERTASALLSNGGVAILALALDKYLRLPSVQDEPNGDSPNGAKAETGGSVPSSPDQQANHTGAAGDHNQQLAAEVSHQLDEAGDENLADFFVPADTGRQRGRPEALLITRAVLHMLNFDNLLDALHDKELVAVLQEAANSDDKRLAEISLSCLINLEVLSAEHTAVRCFLSSARTLCWAPDKAVQFDVFVSHVPVEAADHAWSLLNVLNLRTLRVFMNCRPEEQDLERSLDLIRNTPNFVLLMTEGTLGDSRCLVELRAAVAAGVNVTIISVEGVRWRHEANELVRFVSSPMKAYPHLEDLKTTLLGAQIYLSDICYEDMVEAMAERVKPLSDGWLDQQPIMDIMDDDGASAEDDATEGSPPRRRRSETDNVSEGGETLEESSSGQEEEDRSYNRPLDGKLPSPQGARRAQQGGNKSSGRSRDRHGSDGARGGGRAKRQSGRGRKQDEALGGKRNERRRRDGGGPPKSERTRGDRARRGGDDDGKASLHRKPSAARSEGKGHRGQYDRRPPEIEQEGGQRPRKAVGRSTPPREAATPVKSSLRRSQSVVREQPPQRVYARSCSLMKSPKPAGGSSQDPSLKLPSNSFAVNVPDLLVVEDRDCSSEESECCDEDRGLGGVWREAEERIEEALGDLPLRVASTVKREVENHVEALQAEFRRQVEAVSTELQRHLQSSLDKVVARQSEMQRAVEMSMRAMEQRLAKMEERTAEATTAAAIATAKAEELEARLGAPASSSSVYRSTSGAGTDPSSFAASPGRAPQLAPLGVASQPQGPGALSTPGEGNGVLFYDVDTEDNGGGVRLRRPSSSPGGPTALSAGPRIGPNGDLLAALHPAAGHFHWEGSGFMGVQGAGLAVGAHQGPGGAQHHPRGTTKPKTLPGPSPKVGSKALPPQNIFPAVSGSMIRGSHHEGPVGGHQPAAAQLPAVGVGQAAAGQQNRTFVNLSGGR